MTYLEDLRYRWTEEASFTGILSDFRGSTPREFFDTGEEEVSSLLQEGAEQFGAPDFFGAALDFGCGMGRLTRALADRFNNVTGVDVSPRMIELAQTYDERPTYRLMELAMPKLEPVDFLVSVYVLQHLVEHQAAAYLENFPSLLTETGIGVVQVSQPSDDGGISDEKVREVLGKHLLGVREEGGWYDAKITSRYYWFA